MITVYVLVTVGHAHKAAREAASDPPRGVQASQSDG